MDLLADSAAVRRAPWSDFGLPLFIDLQLSDIPAQGTKAVEQKIRKIVEAFHPRALIDNQGQWSKIIIASMRQWLFLLYSLEVFLIAVLTLVCALFARTEVWHRRALIQTLSLLGADERIILLLLMRKVLRVLMLGVLCSMVAFLILYSLFGIVFPALITSSGSWYFFEGTVWLGIMLQYWLLSGVSVVAIAITSRYYLVQHHRAMLLNIE
jgi:predicted lysophospholipase L1 biosynthesis ABC-type transport system permease subunit